MAFFSCFCFSLGAILYSFLKPYWRQPERNISGEWGYSFFFFCLAAFISFLSAVGMAIKAKQDVAAQIEDLPLPEFSYTPDSAPFGSRFSSGAPPDTSSDHFISSVELAQSANNHHSSSSSSSEKDSKTLTFSRTGTSFVVDDLQLDDGDHHINLEEDSHPSQILGHKDKSKDDSLNLRIGGDDSDAV
jgi:hypothetical protein